MAHDVFISYASDDGEIAQACLAALEDAGVQCWIAPRDVVPGEEWQASIHQAVRDAKAMLLIVSPRSDDSKHVEREVLLALQFEITIVPMRVQEFALGEALAYALNSVHWLDAIQPPIEAHLERMVDHLAAIVDSRSTMAQRTMMRGNAAFAADPEVYSERSAPVANFLGLALGWLGIHRMYLGHYKTGLFQMLTLGGFLVWWIIDMLALSTGKLKDAEGKKLRNQKQIWMAWVPLSVIFIALRGVVSLAG